jgi:decaprenylphospho-beta-D-ribofuranose 2-oxidase
MTRVLSGWGRTAFVTADSGQPASRAEAIAVPSPALPRGLGRSYGDASLPAPGHRSLDTSSLDRFIAFDEATGILEAEGGVTLRAILETFVPRGWFLPVTPGTQWVTLGGAVASNVHGKNHHHTGSLEHFVEALEVITPQLSKGKLRCDPAGNNTELFRATVGGYGLTGLITRVSLRLKRIASPRIRVQSVRAQSLAELFEAFRAHDAGHEYSVAWVDTLARGRALGRGILHLGHHARPDSAGPNNLGAEENRAGDRTSARTRHTLVNVPVFPFAATPGILRPWALRMFSSAYFHLPRPGNEGDTGYEKFFYPLDVIGDWNRLYGPKGFFQYQFVIPDPDASGQGESGVRACLEYLARHDMGSFLAVLKRCGDDTVMLPFCRRGYTLALDIPHRGAETLRRLEELDRIVLGYGGRIYLTKDARLPKETFRAMYPEWEGWMDTVKRYNPEGVGRSLMAERLGLWK